MPRYIITMERDDRRTTIIDADTLDAAVDAARDAFDDTEEDPLTGERRIRIVVVERHLDDDEEDA